MKKAFRTLSSKCSTDAYPIGQLLTNQIFPYIYVPQCPLSNGENRRSLAVSVLELFNSQSRAFFFETDSSCNDKIISYIKKLINTNTKKTMVNIILEIGCFISTSN